MITIVIPVFNESDHILSLLHSIVTYPSVSEILLIDGGSTDETLPLISEFISSFTFQSAKIKVLSNQLKLQGYALNIGLLHSTNDFVVRIDAHALLPSYKVYQKDFFFDILNLYLNNSFSTVGFKQRFCFENVFQSSLFLASHTPFISLAAYRYALHNTLTFNTAWLFAVNSSAALAVGGFRPELTPNEDYDFNQRIIAQLKFPIFIYQELPIYYAPRSSPISLYRQYYRYGLSRFRSEATRRDMTTPSSLYLAVFLFFQLSLAPFLFTLYALYPLSYFFVAFIVLFFFLVLASLDPLNYVRSCFFSFSLLPRLVIGLLLAPLVILIPIFARSLGLVSSFMAFVNRRVGCS